MANIIARAEHRDQLVEITDVVHDWMFDIDTLQLDEEAQRVTFDLMTYADYRRLVKGKHVAGAPKLRLVIEGAMALSIRDTEQIGYYPLNQLEFDASTNILRLLTDVPLVAEISVSSVNVFVERLVD